MKKGKYYITQIGNKGEGPRAVEKTGWIDEIDGVKIGMCANKDSKGKTTSWSASELTTGFKIAEGKNRKETLAKVTEILPKLKEKLKDPELDKYREVINKANKVVVVNEEAKVEEKENKTMAKKTNDNKAVTVEMTVAKMTKNTIRFEEILDSEFAAPKVGTIYVPKSTLGELGYKEGNKLVLTVEVK